MTNGFHNNAIFWVEVDRIRSNPYQPRRDFNEASLQSLADSIKQYGVLQPLVVTRKEEELPDGGIRVYYELVAGERRLRASKLAGISQVPVLIRSKEDTEKEKLELAIIENLQREDLNPIDKAMAFKQLHEKFNMTHAQIAKKMGKSREYISNALRLLSLPEYIQQAIASGIISEGHSRPLLMLIDKPQELDTLFKEITMKKLTVREAEHIARGVATEKVRKNHIPPEIRRIEMELMENLGTRVRIEQKGENAGRVHIDFTNKADLEHLLQLVRHHKEKQMVEFTAPEAENNLANALGSDEQPEAMENISLTETDPLETEVLPKSSNTDETFSIQQEPTFSETMASIESDKEENIPDEEISVPSFAPQIPEFQEFKSEESLQPEVEESNDVFETNDQFQDEESSITAFEEKLRSVTQEEADNVEQNFQNIPETPNDTNLQQEINSMYPPLDNDKEQI